MATARPVRLSVKRPTPPKPTLDESIETTVMAIREIIMEYFKGTCIEKVTYDSNLSLIALREYQPRGQYQYQRRFAETENARVLRLGKVPILTMRHAPDKLTLNVKVLERSKELRKIKAELEIFMDKFLLGVEIEENNGVVIYG